jgi:hypothetical protein
LDTSIEENGPSSANWSTNLTPDNATSNEKAAKHLSLLNLLEEIKESFNDPKLFQDCFASKLLRAESIEQLEDCVGPITEELALREKNIIRISSKQNKRTLYQAKMKTFT